MRTFRLSCAVLLSSLFLAFAAAGVAQQTDGASPALRDELRHMIGQARDRVFPALVSIRVVTAQYSGGREIKGQSVGSGSIVSPDGLVLTNQHVTRNGRKFLCTLSDRREVPARLVGEDPLTDLALLRLDLAAAGLAAGEPLPVAPFGDSAELEIGDYVMAMGSPFSLSRSVSLGIVSNTERVFAAGFGSDDLDEMELERGQRTGLFTRWIQHDALINPGSSGGPLVNLKGEVVGVNELGSGSMGFAIPGNLARRVAAALEEHGEVPRSWIGVSFKPIRRTGLDDGVLIDSIVAGGPAAVAGVEAGDVLLALDGEPVTVRFPEEVPLLLDRLASLPIGSAFELTYRRGDDVATTTVLTRRLEKDLGEEIALHAWGLTAQEITAKMARDLGLESSTAGALLSGVRSGGPAQTAEPALAAGDVVLAVDGQPVATLADLVERYERLQSGDPPPAEIVIQFERRGTDQLALLEPRSDELDDPPRELPKAWIGVATQPVLPRLAEHLGLGEGGFRVTRVYPGTKAADAGLRPGDVIVALDGEPLAPRGMQDAGLLYRRVRALAIDATATLEVRRGGERLALPVTLERTRLTPEEARRHRDGDFELTVRELTFFDRDANPWVDDVEGVLVENVDGGGWAGLGGIRPFDVVLRVGETPIRGLKSFRHALQELKREQPERVVVVVLRGVRTHFQYLEPDWIGAAALE